MDHNGTPIALGVVALLAGAAAVSSRAGSQRGPAPSGRSYLPRLDDLREILNLDYSVDEVTDVFPDAISFPPGDVVGVIISTRDGGDWLLTEVRGMARAKPLSGGSGNRRGSRVAPVAAAGAVGGMTATAINGLILYMGYRFIKMLARKRMAKFVELDRQGQVKMLREEAAKQGSLLFPSGYVSRFAWKAILKDQERAETLAEFIQDFVEKHGDEAEAAADLALAANVPGTGAAMALQRAAKDQRGGPQGSSSR